MKKEKEFEKKIYFCFTDYAKSFDCGSQQTGKSLNKEMGVPDHLTCLLRNLYVGQEATQLDMEQWTVVQNWEK